MMRSEVISTRGVIQLRWLCVEMILLSHVTHDSLSSKGRFRIIESRAHDPSVGAKSLMALTVDLAFARSVSMKWSETAAHICMRAEARSWAKVDQWCVRSCRSAL